jgi:hypothetical protein
MFTFSFLVVSDNIFRKPFHIFYLDKHHPVWLIVPGETTDVDRDTHIVSHFIKCPRVHPCECGSIHEDFFLSCQVYSTFLQDGWSTYGCLAVHPRHKRRKNWSIFFLLDYLVWGECKSGRNTQYDYSRALTLTGNVFSCHFCWLT